MNDLQNEIWRKFALSVLRWVFILLGSWLIKHGVIDQPTLDSVTTPDALLAAFGLIVIGATTVWQYWRSKYSVILPVKALQAQPDTPMSVVKNETKNSI